VIRAALLIMGKDLKERLRDRSAIILAVVVPLGLAFVMNLTLGPVTEQSFSTDVAIHDADGGPLAESFAAMLASIEDEGAITVVRAETADEARALVEAHDVSSAYVLPAGLSEAASGGTDAAILVVSDPDQPIGASVGVALAQAFASEVNAVRLSVVTAAALGAEDPRSLVEKARSGTAPIRLADERIEGRGFDFATLYATGIAVFFLFFTVQFGVLSIVGEREDGTMPRLLAAPIPKSAILIGKLLVSFVVGVASTVVLWLATTLLMDAEWGGSFGVMLLIVAGVTAAMGLTAAVATVAKSAEQAGSITAFIVVVFGVLGGTFFPVSRVSGAFSAVSRITPHFWLMEGFRRSSAGEGIIGILPSLGAILLFAAVLGGIGLVRARDLVRFQ